MKYILILLLSIIALACKNDNSFKDKNEPIKAHDHDFVKGVDSIALTLKKVRKVGGRSFELTFNDNNSNPFTFNWNGKNKKLDVLCVNEILSKLNSNHSVFDGETFMVFYDASFGFPPGVEPRIGECYITEEDGTGVCWPMLYMHPLNEKSNIQAESDKTSSDLESNQLKGVWRRVDNSSLKGMIVEIIEENNMVYGKIIHVPPWSINNLPPQAFSLGEIKWKNIRQTSESKYAYEDLAKDFEKILDDEIMVTESYYEPAEIELNNDVITANNSEWKRDNALGNRESNSYDSNKVSEESNLMQYRDAISSVLDGSVVKAEKLLGNPDIASWLYVPNKRVYIYLNNVIDNGEVKHLVLMVRHKDSSRNPYVEELYAISDGQKASYGIHWVSIEGGKVKSNSSDFDKYRK